MFNLTLKTIYSYRSDPFITDWLFTRKGFLNIFTVPRLTLYLDYFFILQYWMISEASAIWLLFVSCNNFNLWKSQKGKETLIIIFGSGSTNSAWWELVSYAVTSLWDWLGISLSTTICVLFLHNVLLLSEVNRLIDVFSTFLYVPNFD